MMRQFEVRPTALGYCVLVHSSIEYPYDMFYGFSRVIKRLPEFP